MPVGRFLRTPAVAPVATKAIAAPTVAEARTALRLDDDAADAADEILQPLIDVATERVNRVAPCAPAATGKQAILQAVSWLFEMGGMDYSANWFQRSGAASTLKPWKVPRAGPIAGTASEDS